MAEDKKSAPAKKDPAKPKEPPKVQHIGGESLLDRVLPHIKKIIVATIIIAVLVTLFFGYKACQRNKESRATEKVAAVLDVATRLPKPFAPDPSQPSFADDKERADKVLEEMAKQDTEVSPALKASVLVDAGKLDEAIALYRSCESGTGIENVLCREGLGLAIEAKALSLTDPAQKNKGLEEALDAFMRMQPAEDGPRRVYALYHQGRIQAQLGKKPEAKALLEKVKGMSPPQELAQAVDRKLAAL